MKPTRCTITLAALAWLAGCAEPEFRPLQSKASTPVELAAASYDLQLGGDDLGDVKVWSRGTPERPALDAPEDRQIAVGMRVRNDSDQPMRLDLDTTLLELYTAEGSHFPLSGPLQLRGSTDIGAHTTRRLELLYALPEPIKLAEVEGYELSWALAVGDERRVSHATAFRRADERYYPYPYAPMGPYYYGPGWRWGVGSSWRYGP